MISALQSLLQRSVTNQAEGASGFTLLEVMVSVALIGGVFATLLSLQSQSIDTFRRVRDNGIAVMMAQDRLERLRLEVAGFDPIDPINPAALERYEGYEIEVEEEEVSDDEIPLSFIYPAGWSVVKWRVTVSWGEDRNQAPSQFQLVRYVAIKQRVALFGGGR